MDREHLDSSDADRLEVLTRQQCLELLAEHPVHVGRVALVDYWGRPLVFPVNYCLDGEDVVFRTGQGTKLEAATRGVPVAFEVDVVDPFWKKGWSVVVSGRTEHVVEPDRLERLQRLPLRAWVGGQRDCYVRVAAEQVTGRRIV